METLLKSEFAKRVHVSKARVSQMIAMGMPLTADSRVDVKAALDWIESHVDLSHKDSVSARQPAVASTATATAATAPAATAAPPPAAFAGMPADPGRVLLTAKAKRALVELRRAERLERVENEELVEVAEVRRAIDGLISNAKSKLLSLGHRLAPRVAIETDVSRCKDLIDDVVSEALLDLTGYQG
jgi:plasmid maintenance system antidote protein VapI